jgi:uncharacterized membrane protein YczE
VIAPPIVVGGLAVRGVSLVSGLFVCALGVVLMLSADLGLGPWDVLTQGIVRHLGGSFGTVTVAVSFTVLVIAWAFGARVGIGTVANAALVGTFIDLLLRLDVVADLDDSPLAARIAMLVGGIACFGVGSALYLGAALGAGPRDSLMLVLSHRTRTRIGIVRACLEATVGVLGFLLGGTIGVGTVAFAVGVGWSVELACHGLVRLRLARPVDVTASTPWIRGYDRA